ncbi:putative methyltransferase C9orf114 homolog isoform X2 [Chenopodium quinoa]|uniref:putative methyltransferase C9orf114 homolog isoform X2 n=1 Tax=Chenopodium quinoa TaxID=63459 RepID=UPI000B78D61D|nr:putative methyltransferase C9orf114 homolog isoform X2 [Chenopodium quinoa]
MGKKKEKFHPQDEAEQQQEENPFNGTSKLINGDVEPEEEPKRKKKKRKKDSHQNTHQQKTIPTVSIAIPSTIIGNAQSHELATRLAGQIARAATIYRIDEGLLPPLDAPHHLRKHEWASYREGVTLEEKAPNSVGTLVDVGLDENIVIDKVLGPGIRVTVAMGNDRNLNTGTLHQVVQSTTPREEEGMYWGYKVRYAPNLSSVIENCSFEGGYDYVIGTSEHGQVVKSSELCIPEFRHLLITFGGLAGLEECIDKDKKLKGKDAKEVFHSYLNLCPHQGSRTIRSEEAVFIALQYFQEPIDRALQKS